MSLINNTLVFKKRSITLTPADLGFSMLEIMESYAAATVPVPGAEHSPSHYQLLRYEIGPLSFVVCTRAEGSVQELPSAKEASGPQETRGVHGIDVITAGQGALTPMTFQVSGKPPRPDDSESRQRREQNRGRRRAPRLWINGQTKIGVIDFGRPGQGADAGELTVVDLGDRVRKFEMDSQDGLCRLPTLLAILRKTVRAHGGQCVAVFMPKDRPSTKQQPGEYTLQVHSAGPKDGPVLSDWQKEHFWSGGKAPDKHVKP